MKARFSRYALLAALGGAGWWAVPTPSAARATGVCGYVKVGVPIIITTIVPVTELCTGDCGGIPVGRIGPDTDMVAAVVALCVTPP